MHAKPPYQILGSRLSHLSLCKTQYFLQCAAHSTLHIANILWIFSDLKESKSRMQCMKQASPASIRLEAT